MSAAAVLLVAFALDAAFGDPAWLPHPVVFIGKAIALLENALRRIFPATPRGKIAAGGILVILVCFLAFFSAFALLHILARADARLAFVAECFLGYQLLATKCLADAAGKVFAPLAEGDLAAARRAVGMIVGRDTAELSEAGIARAAVETVAENASDGVVAPLLFMAVGGVPLAMLYKAVNTMDSMLGYKNDRYLHFGRVAARLDDAANFLPARLTALLMIPAARFCGLDWRRAWRTYRRDRNNHTSPNAGHPESTCAGALGVQLGGPSVYFGKIVEKPALGDAVREIEPEDIHRTNRLLYATACLALVLCLAFVLAYAYCRDGGWTWN